MSAKPPIDATAAYEHAHIVATGLLEQIKWLLDRMPKPDDKQTRVINWAHVGDVCKVNGDLTEIIQFLGGSFISSQPRPINQRD